MGSPGLHGGLVSYRGDKRKTKRSPGVNRYQVRVSKPTQEKEIRVSEENKKNEGSRKDNRAELEQEGARKMRNLADKAKEKAEKKLEEGKNR